MRAPPFVADLHVHSRYSRACSRDCDLEHLAWWAARKGIGLVGTGDLCHPAWAEEIRAKLVPAEPGLFRLRPDLERRRAGHAAGVRAGPGAVPAVGGDLHDLQAGREDPQGAPPALRARPRRRGRADPPAGPDRQPRLGRPADPRAGLPRPAGDAAGLGRGRLPGAGARLDALVRGARLASPASTRSRTATPTWPGTSSRSRPGCLRPGDEPPGVGPGPLPAGLQLRRALAAGAGPGGDGAVLRARVRGGAGGAGDRRRAGRDDRVLPEEGKYHLDGHRTCEVRLEPGRDPGQGGRCPVCAKPVTVGVLHRVEALADRPPDTSRPGAAGWRCLVQLPADRRRAARGRAKSKAVRAVVDRLVDRFGPELGILAGRPARRHGHGRAARPGRRGAAPGARRRRRLAGGYDGEYGMVRLFDPKELPTCARAVRGPVRPAGRPAVPAPRGRRGPGPAALADRCRRAGPTAGPPIVPPPAGGPPDESGDRRFRSACPPASTVPDRPPRTRLGAGRARPEQRAAAEAAGPLLVVAGPGTGKTRTLTTPDRVPGRRARGAGRASTWRSPSPGGPPAS